MGTFKLPDLGEGLAEAEIVAWHVKPGDQVRVDQPMVSVETAKAVVEVPVPFSGTVLGLYAAVGDIVATGAPLIDFDSGTVVGSMPSACADEYLESDDAAARGASGHPHAASRIRAVPVARAVARRLGVDLSQVAASGAAGVINLDDVLAHVGSGAGTGGSGNGGGGGGGGNGGNGGEAGNGDAGADAMAGFVVPPHATVEPLRGARRAMARSMSLSRDEVAQSTVCDDADLHRWTQRGDTMQRLIRSLVAACAAEPALNAWYDAARQSRLLFDRIDLAIAVDTAGGLIVPVLRDVGNRTPAELRAGIAAQKAAAHNRTTTPADLRGFTLMLSNFGTLAGRYGIARVVPPAVAILGAGKIRHDAVVTATGSLEAHRRLPLSLSFDHRCITGGEACRFLAAALADLEKPD